VFERRGCFLQCGSEKRIPIARRTLEVPEGAICSKKREVPMRGEERRARERAVIKGELSIHY